MAQPTKKQTPALTSASPATAVIEKLEQELIAKNIVNQTQLEAARAQSKSDRISLQDSIVKLGFSTQDKITNALSNRFYSKLLQDIPEKKFLGQILIDQKFIDPELLEQSLKKASDKKVRLGELLVAEGIISEKELAGAIAEQYHLKVIDLEAEPCDPKLIHIVPKNVIRQYLVLPVKMENGVLVLATHDPSKIMNAPKVLGTLKADYQIRIAEHNAVLSAMNKMFAGENSIEEIADKFLSGDKSPAASIEALFNKLLEAAIKTGASDIHIEPTDTLVRIRARIDGMLQELSTLSPDVYISLLSKIKVMGDLDIAEKRIAQDGRFEYRLGPKVIDVRLSTLPTIRGEKAVMRILDKSNLKLNFTELGMEPSMISTLEFLLRRPYGILLVSGPTGSGKTTSVYSMLRTINDLTKNIVTVEDPVEYQFDVINQVQVNTKAGVTFSQILKNILRQDPDVIMVGEIRDRDTADIAIRAALTGHLVISTIHTNDSISTVARLTDMGIEPFLIGSSLLAVLSQRLVRVLCVHCKKESNSDESLYLAKAHGIELPEGTKLYSPVGCDECFHTGFRGRKAIFEIFSPDREIKKMISQGKSDVEISDLLLHSGFKTMRDDGIKKVALGFTTLDELLRVTL